MSLIQKFARGVLFSSLIAMPFIGGDKLDKKNYLDFPISHVENFIPEYKRELRNVFMKFQPEIKYQANLIKEVLKYSDVDFLVAESYKKEFESFSKTLPVEGNKINPIYYKSEGRIRQAWAQDLFEFLVTDKNERVILPNYFSMNSSSSVNSYSSFINLLEQDYEDYIISLNNFEGGSVTYDSFRGKNILFVGDKFSNFRNLNKNEKIMNYKKEFGADSVVFFNYDSNETPLFHLDQCFTFVDSGKVAILNLDKYSIKDFYNESEGDLSIFEKEFYLNYSSYGANGELVSNLLEKSLNYSKKMLNEIKNKFNKLGYETFSLPASYWQILNYQSYINSRLFMNEGKKKILMPIFPNSNSIYDINYFRNKQAKEFFQSCGLEVIPVENDSWIKQGNIHCLINEI